jgi:hypothetical protein
MAAICSEGAPAAAADTQPNPPRTLRIAVCSTPRSGNTWLRRLLEAVYSASHVVVDTPAEIDWQQIGRAERCILQIHWTPEPCLLKRLDEHAFRVVTLLRHPLDLLLSILHFASVWPDTALWFGGRGGDESAIVGVTPRSPQFLRYAAGERARCLLSISREWAATPGCSAVRYESLVQNPTQQLSRLIAQLEPAAPDAVGAAVEANTLDKLRALVQNQHVWKGSPGNWRLLLPPHEAAQIAAAHQDLFEEWHYACDPDPVLDERQADANWLAMEMANLREEFRQARTQLREARDSVHGVDEKIYDTKAKLYRHARQVFAKLDESNRRIAELETELAALRELVSPALLPFARKLARYSVRRLRRSSLATWFARPFTQRCR